MQIRPRPAAPRPPSVEGVGVCRREDREDPIVFFLFIMSSSIPFERYDEEFLSLTEQVTSKLRSLDPSTSGGAPPPSSAEADVKMAHNLLLQADDLLKQMGLEARGVDDAYVKRDLLGKVSV
ncbi:hypothetical protein THAOC_11501 [Thalassiosira oceanica]|uniref:Vesicle transport v-SNARE N-terminal domain-containing protein n=1 Tax=Thalassiosira oceanica TaxID=159749 RepID=K0SQ37_THAOC|nr:hypothetical protein THAOC_11501 [Thalassiosira oceanica]|eukprot:EJK67460.1 hypothetical protein THAOC_11501 [Thalassiosira oceanica]